MYEVLLTYCSSTKNLRNCDFVFILKVFLLNCLISDWIFSISGNRTDSENGQISGPTLQIGTLDGRIDTLAGTFWRLTKLHGMTLRS